MTCSACDMAFAAGISYSRHLHRKNMKKQGALLLLSIMMLVEHMESVHRNGHYRGESQNPEPLIIGIMRISCNTVLWDFILQKAEKSETILRNYVMAAWHPVKKVVAIQ